MDISELPQDWKLTALENVASLSAGGDRPSVYSSFPTNICTVPIFSNGIDEEGLYGYTDKAKIFDENVTDPCGPVSWLNKLKHFVGIYNLSNRQDLC